jgi:integrase
VVEYAGGKVGSIRKGVSNAIERAGIGHLRIHDLRHTAAVTMLAGGVPIEKVAQVLGHSNIAVTYSNYGRYLPEHMQDAVNILDFMNLRGAV